MRPLSTPLGQFPRTRLRRTRMQPFMRDLVRETSLRVTDLIQPVFVTEGHGEVGALDGMPGIARYSIDRLLEEATELQNLGIRAIALFPVIPSKNKSHTGEEAYNPNGLMQQAVSALKSDFPDLGLICDVALDPYTTHGHDGIVDEFGEIQNDETVSVLVEQALSLSEAGADIVAPSDMMDGRILAIREALEKAGQINTQILSYAAKYASNLYSPFRAVVDAPTSEMENPKASYQMDFGNADEALREVALDLQEGADIVMVKPGSWYLDIVARIKENFGVPTLTYHVSGEYAMLMAAVNAGWADHRGAMLEALTCMKRAGADAILSYGAKDAAKWLQELD